ncbi:glycoside hydrolase family 88 protein [Bradyrhizobium canariense]|uniref:Unsaturated chondroitin disaccharide hydrolase n=1 Tax=Bradyrhizobium canariense TaxID=255045 RepID=A0A1H1T685_9BRAD|nr:glycoside hydrolase family 88 protein [Bradyrhizobium canariense]SDS55526.1 unsaturated chondroitin disaccharide hydrolase [Bradyrhizobium canariense]
MSAASDKSLWSSGAERMCRRIDQNLGVLKSEFPHWANSQTGQWTTTPDGDWTGGAWPGMLWLAAKRTGDTRYRDAARLWSSRLKPRARLQTAFKGFGFYYGAALGDVLCADTDAAALALEAAESLKGQFDNRLGLIPLGGDAEESEDVGNSFSSIDSLQATPLLFWAAQKTGDASYADVAARHTSRVLDVHMRSDGSIVQSSELNPKDGGIVRHFTHKGFSDDSVWGRAQAWGLVYTAIALAHRPQEKRWMEQLMKGADWWLANVPSSMIAFWDFNDPAIPDTETDTAATAITCSALLKLAQLALSEGHRARYRDAGERTAAALVGNFLTPVGENRDRPDGMLVGACFNKRRDARAQDSATNAETIFGSYYLFESLNVLDGLVEAARI